MRASAALVLRGALSIASFVGVSPASAQTIRAGEVARLVEMRPREGALAEFEAGYRRHLEWHHQNRDPWTWRGWFVATGDRAGTFVDGTFGHAWADLDASIRPTEDAGDNASNVAPHVVALFNGHAVRLPERCRGDEAEALGKPLLTTLRVRLRTGRESELFSALSAWPESVPLQSYRLVGGPAPSYLLAVPHDGWKALGAAEGALGDLLRRAGEAVAEARLETLRHRPDLSYAPGVPGKD